MKCCRILTRLALGVLLCCGSMSRDLAAQTNDQPLSTISDIVDAEILAAIRFQPHDIDFARLGIRLRSLFPSGRNSFTTWFTFAGEVQKQLETAGVREFAILFSSHSGPGFQPIFCIPQSNQRQAADAKELIPQRLRSDYQVQQFGAFWVAASQPALDRIKSRAQTRTPEDEAVAHQFTEFLLAGNEAVRGIARVSEDHKRAMRERELMLPDWLGGSMVAVAAPVKHITIVFDADDEVTLQLDAIPINEQQHDNLKNAFSKLVTGGLEHIGVSTPGIAKTLGQIQASEQGSRLAVSTTDGSLAAYRAEVVPAIDRQFAELAKLQAQGQMRSIVLMILNHDSAYKMIPPAGGIEKLTAITGKLSWRVHALPFIGDAEAKLYSEFHLDEDWDSPHNKQFISKMPALFLFPNSKLQLAEGRSNFCVPTGENTMWPMDRIIGFDDITDGAPNTIAVLEVRDELAQIWTKPEALVIDPNRLAEQLGGHFGNEFLMSTANGLHLFQSLDFDPKVFVKMLTRNAGD